MPGGIPGGEPKDDSPETGKEAESDQSDEAESTGEAAPEESKKAINFGDSKPPADADPAELAAWASLLYNRNSPSKVLIELSKKSCPFYSLR